MLVEALTDNRNRTAADVRHVFAKHDGNLGDVRLGRVAVRAAGRRLVDADGVDEDELMLAAAEGAPRTSRATARRFAGDAAPEDLAAVREAVEGRASRSSRPSSR